MDWMKLKELIAKRGFDVNHTDRAIETTKGFEAYLGENSLKADDRMALDGYCKILIGKGENTWHNIFALALYGRLAGIEPLAVNAMELLDGAEAFGNLRKILVSAFGEDGAEKYLEDAREPVLGEPNTVRPEPMGKVISRLEQELGHEKTAGLICSCLRDLDDSWYVDSLKLFGECGRDIDKFIKARGDRFIGELVTLKNEDRLYFTQPITDDVIEFVRANPEIHYGVRDGNFYYDTKIPHQTAKMLAETDPVKRRYHYCHCPWVKDSLKDGKSSVPPVFCNCSAGFHKRMWEILLGHPVKCEVLESVLSGGDRCRFRVEVV